MHENFFHKIKIYYEDTDSGGVVYYANYLKFLERARTEALFSIGFSNTEILDQFSSLIIVKSCSIEYKNPAHLEDELTIRSFVKSITKTSFFMNQIISRENDQKFDDLIVEAQVHLVFVDKNGNQEKYPMKFIQNLNLIFVTVLKFSNFFCFSK